MESKIYFVAIGFSSEFVKPTIVEQFNGKADADNYAALMSRTKNRKYTVLEQVTEWENGTPQEK